MNQRELFFAHLGQTSDNPLAIQIKKAKGCYFWDSRGKKYIDLISGISVSSLGHCNSKVVKAIQKQASKYLHTMVYGEHIQAPQVQLAKALCEILPSQLDKVYFVNSGSEAIEAAMKLAKKKTGRSHFIAQKYSYHGSTHGALSLMSDTYFKEKYEPLLPDISFIEQNNMADVSQITSKTAAVIIELVQAERGIYTADLTYIKAIKKRCEKMGCLLILDEIQSGMGRTGKFFAFEHFGIVPDILVLAKAFGAGMPLACLVANNTLLNLFTNNPPLGHISTFGGHPVSCAASLAGMQLLNKNNWVAQADAKGILFKKNIQHTAIKEIRQIGLWLAIDFEDKDFNHLVIDECIANGIHVDWFLFNETSMRIAPPLIIKENEIKLTCKNIVKIIDRMYEKYKNIAAVNP